METTSVLPGQTIKSYDMNPVMKATTPEAPKEDPKPEAPPTPAPTTTEAPKNSSDAQLYLRLQKMEREKFIAQKEAKEALKKLQEYSTAKNPEEDNILKAVKEGNYDYLIKTGKIDYNKLTEALLKTGKTDTIDIEKTVSELEERVSKKFEDKFKPLEDKANKLDEREQNEQFQKQYAQFKETVKNEILKPEHKLESFQKPELLNLVKAYYGNENIDIGDMIYQIRLQDINKQIADNSDDTEFQASPMPISQAAKLAESHIMKIVDAAASFKASLTPTKDIKEPEATKQTTEATKTLVETENLERNIYEPIDPARADAFRRAVSMIKNAKQAA